MPARGSRLAGSPPRYRLRFYKGREASVNHFSDKKCLGDKKMIERVGGVGGRNPFHPRRTANQPHDFLLFV